MINDPVDSPQRLLFGVDGVRAIDRAAIVGGTDGYALMTRAAQYALDTALAGFPGTRRWQILCGGGNNGGDGYVLARLADAHGIDVTVTALSDPQKLAGDAQKAWRDATAAGIDVTPFEQSLDETAELLVDAMLGSGLARDLDGRYADAVRALSAHVAPVLALDLPTGLNGDSGRIMGAAVTADITATFVARKPGLFLGDGPDCCGRIRYSGLGIDAEHFKSASPVARLTAAGDIRRWLPRRKRQAHKGDFGHVLVVGGDKGMPGAARLAGEAALVSGAGRVTVATHPENAQGISARRPELMCHGVTSGRELSALLATATVVAIGPGLGTGEWSRELYTAVSQSDLPLVVDADALTLLAESPGHRLNRVLTPHPGEAGRLLGMTAAAVQQDRFGTLQNLAEKYGHTVVLKGAGTLISGDGCPWLCAAGNPGMAAPGMGDVLTGVIAALLAQKLAAEHAAVAAVHAHARAGDVAATAGERGMLASGLIDELRPWLNG